MHLISVINELFYLMPTSITASGNLDVQEPLVKTAKNENLEVEARAQSHITFIAEH